MAKGVWEETTYEDLFLVDGTIEGYIEKYDDISEKGTYRAKVYPPGNGRKTVAENASYDEARKAVEDYWADKTPDRQTPAEAGQPKWENHEDCSYLYVDGHLEGFIERQASGEYTAVVDFGNRREAVAEDVSKAEAKAAVEEYL